MILLIGTSLSSELRAEEFLICKASEHSASNPFVEVQNPDPRMKRVKQVLHRLAGDDLSAFVGVTPHVRFSNDSTPNAFVNESNTIVLSDGLMRLVETDDELAFVLAHELAHIALHHNRSGTHRSHALIGAGGTLQRLILREIAADRFAISILRASGIDPGVALPLLERLSGFGWETGQPLRSRYPSLEARLEALGQTLTVASCGSEAVDGKQLA